MKAKLHLPHGAHAENHSITHATLYNIAESQSKCSGMASREMIKSLGPIRPGLEMAFGCGWLS